MAAAAAPFAAAAAAFHEAKKGPMGEGGWEKQREGKSGPDRKNPHVKIVVLVTLILN